MRQRDVQLTYVTHLANDEANRKNPLQGNTFAPREPKGRGVVVPRAARQRQREAADAEHDQRRGHAQRPAFPGHARTGWSAQPLAASVARLACSRRRGSRRHRHARDHTDGRGAGTERARLPAQGACRQPRREGDVDRHQARRATRLAQVAHVGWITSGKTAETRDRRIATACDMLASGKRRACCFDRSGVYSKAFSAPVAAG